MDLNAHEDLWASRMLPEGVIEHWFARDGDDVEASQTGRGAHRGRAARACRAVIWTAFVNDIIEPGALLCSIDS